MLAGVKRHARYTTGNAFSRAYTAARGDSPNQGIIAMLQAAIKASEADKSLTSDYLKMRKMALARAILAVGPLRSPITSAEEALRLKGVGRSIAHRIELYLAGDHDAAVHGEVDPTSSLHALAQFSKVPGLGPTTAQRLVDAGCMSLAQLRENPSFQALLTPAKLASALYHDQLRLPVQRAETEALVGLVREHIPEDFKLRATNSYRRDSATSSEVTLVISHPLFSAVPQPSAQSPFASAPPPKKSRYPPPRFHAPLPPDVASLFEESVIHPLRAARVLVVTPGGNDTEPTPHSGSWSGIASFPATEASRDRTITEPSPRFVHLNLHLVPWPSRASALLAATGDGAFVHALQVRAAKLGMRLDEFGVWRWAGPPAAEGCPAMSSGVDNAPTSPPAAAQRKRGRPRKALEPGSEPVILAPAADAFGSLWELVPTETEEDIFDALGFDWVEPARRGWAFLERSR